MIYLPDNYNWDVIGEKFSDREEFVRLQKKYRTALEKYLDKKVHLRRIEKKIARSGVQIPDVGDQDYNFYHQTEVLQSGCLFVRNNIYIERLSEEDLEYLAEARELKTGFIERTFPEVIYEYSRYKGSHTIIGSPILENSVLCESIYMEFAFDFFGCEPVEKLFAVEHLAEKVREMLTAGFQKARIPLSFLIYKKLPDYFLENKPEPAPAAPEPATPAPAAPEPTLPAPPEQEDDLVPSDDSMLRELWGYSEGSDHTSRETIDWKKIMAEAESLSECVKPWKWFLFDRPCPVPKQVDPALFHCRACTACDSLVQYRYKGQPLYVCRNCGEVYELEPQNGKYILKTWSALRKQPYYWKKLGRYEGITATDLIHCSGAIKRHPIIEAPCTGDPSDAAEMIVRHLIYINDISGRSFFSDKTNEKSVSYDRKDTETQTDCVSEELVVADGKPGGTFPKDEFTVLREDRDHITFESNGIQIENVYGYTADVNLEDWESVAYYTSLTITFLGDSRDDLPSGTEVLDYIPRTEGNYCERKWIIRNPLGLEGYFRFERHKESYDFGYWYHGESDD